jgi:hypothetical protein
MMKIVIDRFEGAFAVCENLATGEMMNIDKGMIPKEAKEGTVINLENGMAKIDADTTKERMEKIKRRMDKLWE